MASFKGVVENNQIILKSNISVPGKDLDSRRVYDSLLDTGAQGSLISQKVVDDVGLIPIGDAGIIPVNGTPILLPRYRIRIDIPITTFQVTKDGRQPEVETTYRGVNNIEAILFPHQHQPVNHDVLLGMDFLGAIHFTMFHGEFIISI